MKLLVFFLLFVSITIVHAKTDNQDGFWFGTFAKKKLYKDFDYWIEAQPRYNLSHGEMAQILYRTGLLHSLWQKTSLGYLYGYIQGGNNKEHRLTLQTTTRYQAQKTFKLSHRTRLEGRFFEDNENDSVRFRFLIRADQVDFKDYGLIVWNEFFWDLTDEDASKGEVVERNRFFIGFKKLLLENSRLEIGYMNQFVPRESQDISEHILTLYLFF